ncbi:hypothetical protein [Lutibacter sp. HS1-25]|uniref:hypothetical protein n=1 Tax=Lutibacter sp. HS1-25 TaxID=2485000 RepID=UPI00101240FA|nr:hypothetical protein [Lutibacter sp. HS1-25]
MKTPKRNQDFISLTNKRAKKSKDTLNNFSSVRNKGKFVRNDFDTKINLVYKTYPNKPLKPKKFNINQRLAQANIDNYKPSRFVRIFGFNKNEIHYLNYLLKLAIKEDEKEYDLRYKKYLSILEIWNDLQKSSKHEMF